MADLTRRRSDSSDQRGGRDRGQFLLVGAFGIAVLLLVLAGVVNTVTYTESIATRDTGPNGRDVAALQEDARRGTAGIIARVNADDGSIADKTNRLGENVGAFSEALERQQGLDVASINVSVVDTTNGTRIAQSSTRNLTNVSATSDWTLASEIENQELRRFRLNLSKSSLVSGSCGSSDCYELVVTDGSSSWRVAVNQDAVIVDAPGTSNDGSCSIDADSDRVRIDVTGGTVNGQVCEPLQFAQGVSTPYEVEYRNGGNAVGTYSLVVKGADFDASNYGEEPSVSSAIYATDIRVTYLGPEIEYQTVVRVAGGEPDG